MLMTAPDKSCIKENKLSNCAELTVAFPPSSSFCGGGGGKNDGLPRCTSAAAEKITLIQ